MRAGAASSAAENDDEEEEEADDDDEEAAAAPDSSCGREACGASHRLAGLISNRSKHGWQSGTTGMGCDYPSQCPRGNSRPRACLLPHDGQGTLPMPVTRGSHGALLEAMA
uniref:Uncharacterized protein n=1 Tax=Oryza nivara TaxID=4536 RepID=A0A0E0H3Q3_ORYNI